MVTSTASALSFISSAFAASSFARVSTLSSSLARTSLGKLADDRALLRAELAHLLEDSGQLAPLAEVLHAQRLKILRLLRAADGLKGFDADGF